MKRHPSAAPRWFVPAVIAVLLVFPTVAAAQGGLGFLFKRPVVSIGVRAGYSVAQAGSDVFDFTREQLTVVKRDFNAPTWGLDFAVRVTERFDVALSFGQASSNTRSEFRDWVDLDDRPIAQSTRFVRRPLTLSVKAYFWDRGRRISRFAWVPETWSPYVGAGGGRVWYEFQQDGDFVDFETLDIFVDTFRSKGSTPTVHAFAGVDYSLAPRFVVTVEGRYSWAKAEMGRDFEGFDKIDLAGFQATVGLAARF